MTFPEWLESVKACAEARAWVALLPDQSPEYAWEHCERGDWMLWWHEKVGTRFKTLAPVAYAAVNRALAYEGVECETVVGRDTAREARTAARDAGTIWAVEAARAAMAARWSSMVEGAAANGAAYAAAEWASEAAAAEESRLCAEDCHRMLAMPDMSAILNPNED
jgi:hypothetical protein